MAKAKQIRALKSSGVEPLAPALIKRIQCTLVLKAEDRRWASEIGRLSMLGELTARQTSAAYHVGEIYGRFEWLHRRRRSAASPSYEIGRGGMENTGGRAQDQAIEADFRGLYNELPEQPRELGPILEALCVEDRAVPPGWLDLVRGVLEHLDGYFRRAQARARRGRRRIKRLPDREGGQNVARSPSIVPDQEGANEEMKNCADLKSSEKSGS